MVVREWRSTCNSVADCPPHWVEGSPGQSTRALADWEAGSEKHKENKNLCFQFCLIAWVNIHIVDVMECWQPSDQMNLVFRSNKPCLWIKWTYHQHQRVRVWPSSGTVKYSPLINCPPQWIRANPRSIHCTFKIISYIITEGYFTPTQEMKIAGVTVICTFSRAHKLEHSGLIWKDPLQFRLSLLCSLLLSKLTALHRFQCLLGYFSIFKTHWTPTWTTGSFCMCSQGTSVYGLIERTFAESAQSLNAEKSQGRCKA